LITKQLTRNLLRLSAVSRFHHRLKMSSLTAKEIQIPVPWGHVAAKEWGDSSGEPWILVHGWLDNAGSFDPLIANYFPSTGHRLIAIDVPGHGFSSHYPKGFYFHYLDGLQVIRRVSNHLNLDNFNIMGHSMGAGMCMVFAATFPECVKRLVQLESLKPMSRNVEMTVDNTRAHFDSLLHLENKPEKVYASYDEAYERQREGMEAFTGEGTMTKEALDAIATRSIRQLENPANGDKSGGGGFVFRRDIRFLVKSLYMLETAVIKEYAQNVKCPHLAVMAKGRKNFEDPAIGKEVVQLYRESNPDGFRLERVPGHHQVHLTNPERVWPVIQNFLHLTDKPSSKI